MKTLKDFMVTYFPGTKEMKDLLGKIKIDDHADRNGNGDDVFKATNVTPVTAQEKLHGYAPGEDEKHYANNNPATFLSQPTVKREETEQLDEISKELAGRYINSAHIDKSGLAHDIGYQNGAGVEAGREKDSHFEKDQKKHGNRSSGIQMAVKRLLKKEVAETVEEGMKLIATHHSEDGKDHAKVYKDSEWGEYRVKFHKNGKHLVNADYHTDDKEDAHGTAKYQVKNLKEEVELEEGNELLIAKHLIRRYGKNTNSAHIKSAVEDLGGNVDRVRHHVDRMLKEDVAVILESKTELHKTLHNATYNTPVKLPGYNGKVTAKSAVHARDSAHIIRRLNPSLTKKDHLDLAGAHHEGAKFHDDQWHHVVNKAAHETFGRPYEFHDYKISGIASDKFSEHHKEALRNHAHSASDHKRLAAAHEYAAKHLSRGTVKEDFENVDYYASLIEDILFEDVVSEDVEIVTEDTTLRKSDHDVMRSFASGKPASSNKLHTDGKRLDGNWMGGSGIAHWDKGKVHLNNLGSRAGQTVNRALKKKHLAPNDIHEETETLTEAHLMIAYPNHAKKFCSMKHGATQNFMIKGVKHAVTRNGHEFKVEPIKLKEEVELEVIEEGLADKIRNHPAVESYHNDGPGEHFVNLKRGYHWSGQGAFGTETATEAHRLLKHVRPGKTEDEEREEEERSAKSESVNEEHKIGDVVSVSDTSIKNQKITHVRHDINKQEKPKYKVGGKYWNHSSIVKEEVLDEARQAMPLRGHDYHGKTDAELHYIIKDAGEAAKAMRDHSPKSESKYLDQVNDAHTVLGYRKRTKSGPIRESKEAAMSSMRKLLGE